MADVDRIEACQRREEAPIDFGDRRPHQVAARGQALVEFIEHREELGHGLVIGVLRGRKARPVDAVVDGVVDAFLEDIQVRDQCFGPQVESHIGEGIKGLVEHAHHER